MAERSDSEVGGDLVELRRQADRIESKLAAMTVAANRRGIGREDGHHSVPAWIRWQTGQTLGEIRTVEQAGQVAELLPATGASLAPPVTSAPGRSR